MRSAVSWDVWRTVKYATLPSPGCLVHGGLLHPNCGAWIVEIKLRLHMLPEKNIAHPIYILSPVLFQDDSYLEDKWHGV